MHNFSDAYHIYGATHGAYTDCVCVWFGVDQNWDLLIT